MHTSDDSSRAQYGSQIPSMRTAQDVSGGSGTPIYDALYSEYRRLSRALPGDRTDEESLRFNGFEPLHRSGRHRGALPPGSTADKRQPGL